MEISNDKLLEKIKSVLLRRAEGYDYFEETDEYISAEEPENEQLCFIESKTPSCLSPPKTPKSKLKLSKKKVSSHHIPPDLSAVKMLLDLFLTNKNNDLSSLSTEELNAMKEELIKKLSEL